MAAITENRTVTATEAKAAILRCFTKQRPLFLWGPPGIGKSELVEGITKDMGGLMIDLRLAQMDPTDIRGIPYFNKDLGVMDWAPPIDLPDEATAAQYPIVVLFLDEMNSAAPSVQAVAYQLVLNRRVGKYKLPDNVVMVAAGNREGDKGVSYRMPAPLANRFVHLEMRVDFQSWLQWATENRIHKDVIGYCSFAKQDLYDFDPKSSSRSFATPRSWTFVSELLDDGLADSTTTDMVAGTIGEGTAVKFMAHRKIAGQMPLPEDILSGKVTELKIKEISAIARKNGVLLFTDATQAVGKIPVDVNTDGIDLMAFSAHKMYGPKGVGALYVRRKNPRVKVTAQMDGGGHERGMRSGTLNVPGIVGLGKACEICRLEMDTDTKRISKLRNKLETELMRLEEAYINGSVEHRLPHVSNISFKYVEGEGLLMGFNKDIALSSGSACTSASLEPSYVLKALGLGDDLAHSSLRFGLGRFTTEDQIDFTIKAISETVIRLREMSPLWEMYKEGIDLNSIEWAHH